jgi:hypothetical protein
MPSLLHQAIMLFKSSVHACTFKETSLSLSCLDLAILLALEILACSEEEKNIQCFCSNQSLLLTLLHIFWFFFERYFVCLLPLFLGFAMKLLSAASLVSLLL